MPLTINTRQSGTVTILECAGRIVTGESCQLFRETVINNINKGNKKQVLNLGETNHIDSSGLYELVSAYTTIRNKGGDIKLCCLTRKTKDLLQMTRLSSVFDDFDTETKAVASLEQQVGK